MLALTLLLSCAGSIGPDAPDPSANAAVDLALHAPRLCLSAVPEATRLPRAERDAIAAARTRVASGDAETPLLELPAHPSADVLQGAVAALQGRNEDARATFRDLANVWVDDACLQQAAAYTSFRAGQFAYARPYMDAARRLAPQDLDVGLLDAIMTVTLTGDEEAALAQLRALVTTHPDSAKARAWLGRALLARGEAAEALPHLKAAQDAEIDVSGALALASLLAPDLGIYLGLVGVSPPLPVDVREDDDPVAAYKRSLGMTGDDLIATIDTSLGPVRCELFWERAPLTVGNFIGLTQGTTPWVDDTGIDRKDPLYPGTTFHRVIPGFMIQGGDPLGTGSGGPGYAFLDEIHPDLRFDQPGRLAMANSGPGTNGSQWFITEISTPHLDGKHTIFGQCDDPSMEVVRTIARVPKGAMDLPVDPVLIHGISFGGPL